ncbi:MAG: hypothetical protein DYG98_21755 [Haliscomenobacteraceae bacterium CHB4]|nr:hypothetical protein [Haliscomenobacteraceae bacterium CHB4]
MDNGIKIITSVANFEYSPYSINIIAFLNNEIVQIKKGNDRIPSKPEKNSFLIPSLRLYTGMVKKFYVIRSLITFIANSNIEWEISVI